MKVIEASKGAQDPAFKRYTVEVEPSDVGDLDQYFKDFVETHSTFALISKNLGAFDQELRNRLAPASERSPLPDPSTSVTARGFAKRGR